MKKIKKIVCWICAKEYDSETAAKECESEGLMVPHFNIGDLVKYRSVKEDEMRVGTVVDILLQMPPKYPCALGHTYQVSYLVRFAKRGSGIEYFNGENIKFLQTVQTVEVVYEGNMLFGDGTEINEGAYGASPRRSRRIIVTSWDAYVANIGRKNPKLNGRLVGFTARLRGFNCLDK